MSFPRASSPNRTAQAPLYSVTGTTYTTAGNTYTASVPAWAQSLELHVIGAAGNPGIVTITWTDYNLAAGGTRAQTFTFSSTQQLRVQIPVLGSGVAITIAGIGANTTGVSWNLTALASPPVEIVTPGTALCSGTLVLPGAGSVSYQPQLTGGGTWFLTGLLGGLAAGNTGSTTFAAILPGAPTFQILGALPTWSNNNSWAAMVALPNAPVQITVSNGAAGAGTAVISLIKAG